MKRWHATNMFYREPVIVGELKPDFTLLDPYFPQVTRPENWKVTLPSPFTMARLCEDRTTDKFEGTLENVSQFLKQVIRHLEDRGVSFVQLNESVIPDPNAQTNPEDINLLIKSLQTITYDSKAKIGLYAYFGDGSPIIRALEQADSGVDLIGVDFIKTDYEDVPAHLSKPLIAGVVNTKSSRVEDPEIISPIIERIQEHTQPPGIYLTNNTDFRLISDDFGIATKKLHVLGELIK